MEPRRFCRAGLRDLAAGRATWAAGLDRAATAALLGEGAEALRSGYEFAWHLWLAALRAEQGGDPAAAAAARAVLRAWERRERRAGTRRSFP